MRWKCCARTSRALRRARASRSTVPPCSCRAALAISMAARVGWPMVNVLLALRLPADAAHHLEVARTRSASRRRRGRCATQSGSRFSSFLTRPRAIEILAFVVLYKIADQLTQALTRPFLIDMGYNADQRGHRARPRSAIATTIVGAFVRRLGHHACGPGALALDLRLPAALLERRLLRAFDPRRAESAGACMQRPASSC